MDSSVKSCGPQPFTEALPSKDWEIDQLGEFAASQHEDIVGDETTLAPRYWRLGLALNLAREQIRHGNWIRFIEAHGIDRTRASRARAIHRTFKRESDLDGLTVEQAYARREKPGGGRTSESQDPQQKLASFLKSLCHLAEDVAADAQWTSSESAADLLKDIDEAVSHLDRIREVLQGCVDAAK